jgi:hypothetical protein
LLPIPVLGAFIGLGALVARLAASNGRSRGRVWGIVVGLGVVYLATSVAALIVSLDSDEVLANVALVFVGGGVFAVVLLALAAVNGRPRPGSPLPPPKPDDRRA